MTHTSALRAKLEDYFEFRSLGTNWRTEVLAGVTTFLTMAYIVFVNPSILAQAGVPPAAAMAATCLCAAVGSLLMGFYARYPIALAPGMGINAYFAYTVVKGMGLSWQTALGTVFLAGLAFVTLFVAPVVGFIPAAATAPALIVVGSLMVSTVAEIPWSNPVVAMPAFLTMVTIPLTFSIANGIAIGFISYTLLKVLRGEGRRVNWLTYVLAALFIARFAYLGSAR